MSQFKRLKIMDTNKERGFTLIEVMIAMVVLGIGLLAIAGLQSREMTYNNSSKRQTQAYTWAMEASERLMSEPFGTGYLSIGAHSLNPSIAEEKEIIDEMYPYVLTWEVIDNSESAGGNIDNSLLVNIHISWDGKEIANLDLTRVDESI